MKIGACADVFLDPKEVLPYAGRHRVDPRPELAEIPYDDPEVGIINEVAATNFEIKYLQQGRPIYRVAYQKS